MKFSPEALKGYEARARYKVYHHLGRFSQDVEDVVQETMKRFLQAAGKDRIRNPQKAGSFLSGICNNIVQEYRRKQLRNTLPEEPAPAAVPAVPPAAEGLELVDLVAAIIEQLPARDGEMLRSYYLEEKTTEEVCIAVGITQDQFRVALFRAKARFRKIFPGP